MNFYGHGLFMDFYDLPYVFDKLHYGFSIKYRVNSI